MDIFLAGATGVVGRPTIRILATRHHRVFAMTRRAALGETLWESGAIPVVADALQPDSLARALKAIRPDVVLHQLTDLALLNEPDRLAEALARNAHLRTVGTSNLIAAAAAAGVQHVVAQSVAWLYRPGPEPFDEADPLDLTALGSRGISVTGVAAHEQAVLSTAGVHGCVLRYGQFYGPGTGSAVPGQLTMPVHVEAAAWAGVLAAEKRAAGVYNVSEPNSHLRTEKAQRELGWDASLRA